MAEKIGITRESHGEGWATVVTDRKGACGGCHTGGSEGCRSCLVGSKMESRTVNTINRPGDIVKLNLRTADLYKGEIILYLTLVLCLMVAALVGVRLAQEMGWNETTGAVLAGGTGLEAGLALVILLNRTSYVRRRMMPTIKAVVTATVQQASCCS